MLSLRQSLVFMIWLACVAPACAAEGEWHEFANARQGYSLRLPPELQLTFEKRNDPEWSVKNLMPFDYANFRPPQDSSASSDPLELGIGVHYNRRNLTARAFADNKDAGVRATVRQFVTKQSYDVVVAGIKSVRDDFALEKESGWISYSRVIIPYRDKFYVLLFTSGWEKPVPSYEKMFQQALDSFRLNE